MPEHEAIEFEECAVCERTLLIGERPWQYLAPSGEMRTVCTLCKSRAEASGWVPEGVPGSTSLPAQRPRGRRFGRGRLADAAARVRRPVPDEHPVAGEGRPDPNYTAIAELAARPSTKEPEREPVEDDGHLDGEPEPPLLLSDAQVVDRALEIFNASEEQRQVGGLRRTLGNPKVSVRHTEDGREAVVLVIAWDLSWYEWEVDLADGDEGVTEVRKGSEVSDLGEPSPLWNAGLDEADQVLLAPG